jgi:hypothetical protein
LILLTAREHFISHKLLCEIYPDQKKLIFAYWMMANKTSNKQYDRNYNISSHEYERLKILFSNTSSENNKGKPSPLKGKKRGPLSDEHKQKLRAANLGRVMTTEQKAIVSAANKGKVISEETKQKISNALKGIPKSKETKMKMKLAQQSRFNKSC